MDEVELVENNIKLVYSQLHKFHLAQDADAISYGMEGLLKAARTFDSSKSIKFSTYATSCIYNAVAGYLRTRNRKRVIDVQSYEEPITDNLCLFDCLSTSCSLEEAYIHNEYITQILQIIDNVLETLPESTQKRTIAYWRDSDFTASQAELAKEIGISQPMISRILSEFRYKVRKELQNE